MQSLDEILIHITSMTKQLIRKLNELEKRNEKLRKENKQLKQKLSASNPIDLFNMPKDDESAKDKQNT